MSVDRYRGGNVARFKAAAWALAIMLCLAPGPAAAAEADIWGALRSEGHLALLRHALAPGTGDPAAFDLEDCSSQRNLSGQGRDQAGRIGARFRANGITVARVFSSQWCRCSETARLLGLGDEESLPALNSFYERPQNRDKQTRALEEWLAGQSLTTPLVLVTHQVNITALTGVYPASGELVIVKRSEAGVLSIIGTIETD